MFAHIESTQSKMAFAPLAPFVRGSRSSTHSRLNSQPAHRGEF